MDLYHIGVSGGKDSTALLLWAVYESGYPLNQIRATFCDTGNENRLTYEFLALLNLSVFPVEVIKPERDFYELARWKQRFPSARARFCTTELKMKPTQAWLLEQARAGHTVILHSGVRAAESAARAKLPSVEWDGYFAAEVRRPLLAWTIASVWEIHQRYGVPRNPLYDLGFTRVGCSPCIMCRKREVRLLARHFPEVIGRLRGEEAYWDNANGMSTFFARGKVPEIQRTKYITTKDGRQMKVATIDDVVRWSDTTRGGTQAAMFPELEEEWQDDDAGRSCPSAIGQCE